MEVGFTPGAGSRFTIYLPLTLAVTQAVLVRMGDAAVDPMAAAYARPGWLERMTIGLVTTGAHRRRQIARALCESGTRHAEAALSRLRATEQDPGLALQLDEALHRLRASIPEGPR